MPRLRKLLQSLFFRLVTLLPLLLLLPSCALLPQHALAVKCPVMPPPPAEAMVAPQYQKNLTDLFTPSTQPPQSSSKDETQMPK